MNEEKLNEAHESALAVLKTAVEEGTLSDAHKAKLAELIGAGIRYKTEKTLETSDATKPVYTAELVKKLDLEAQYGKKFDTLKHYGFLTESGETKEGDVQLPTFEKAMSTFKPEEMEIASYYQKPTLLLIPETSFAAKVKALNANKDAIKKISAYVFAKIYSETDSGSEKITGWRAVIVDGAQEMEAYDGDNVDLSFGERVKNRKEARRSGEKGMDRHRYILLMMEAIRNGDPVDKDSFTLLDDDPAFSHFIVPRASFSPSGQLALFDWQEPYHVASNARFRSSVGGDVILS